MKQAINIIKPLSDMQQQDVINRTQFYIKQATKLFDLKAGEVEITFDLKGRSAGMYRVKNVKGRIFMRQQKEIRYNSHIFAKYFDDSFTTTIPHEVAHYVTDIIYGLKNIRPHGKEWKAVMQAFEADDSVTANYDLSGIPLKKQTLFTYQCECREHRISSIRHNKIKKRRYRYYCSHCKQKLHYKQPQTMPV